MGGWGTRQQKTQRAEEAAASSSSRARCRQCCSSCVDGGGSTSAVQAKTDMCQRRQGHLAGPTKLRYQNGASGLSEKIYSFHCSAFRRLRRRHRARGTHGYRRKGKALYPEGQGLYMAMTASLDAGARTRRPAQNPLPAWIYSPTQSGIYAQ